MCPKQQIFFRILCFIFPLFFVMGASLWAKPKKNDQPPKETKPSSSDQESGLEIQYDYPDQNELKKMVELGLSGKQQEALVIAVEYHQKHKDHPCGPFALGLVHEWIIEPQEPEPYLGPAIEAFEEAGKMDATRPTKKNVFDAPAGICRGASLMRLTRIYYKYGQLITAIQSGIAGGKELKRVSKYAPKAYDLYTFLGPYLYFTDRSPAPARFLMRLFRLKGDRKKGLEQLHLAWKKAPLFRPEAGQLLYVIGTKHEGQYRQYKHILDELIEEYPNNVIYQRLYAQSQKKKPYPYPFDLPEDDD